MHQYDNLIPYQVSQARRACVADLSRASREQVASYSRYIDVSQVLGTCEQLPRPYRQHAQEGAQPRISLSSQSTLLSTFTLVSASPCLISHGIAVMIGRAKANSSGLASLE